jgi:hypothetical protein
VSAINIARPLVSQGYATVTGMGHLLDDARVSTTTDQQPRLQVDAITATGCYWVFVETTSGRHSPAHG